MTAGKYFSKILFQCKCVLFFYFYLFLTVSQKCLGEWTLCHCCISRKFSSYMDARYVDMDMDMNGKFYIHGNPAIHGNPYL